MIMQNFFNVTEYGVKPDRPDIIQTEVIQKVIDIAAAKGGTVFFPQGNYKSGSLFFKKGTALVDFKTKDKEIDPIFLILQCSLPDWKEKMLSILLH